MKTLDTDKSLRRYQIAGFAAVLIMSAGIGTWSAMASIHGAVIAPAVIMAESYSKRIQHKEGGIVREIKVRDGDRVEQGQELIVLDDTETRSELGIVNALLREFLSKRARLDAQRDGSAAIEWPEEVTAKADDPEVARVMAGQKKLFETRRAAVLGKKEQLKQQIGQLREQIRGLVSQQQSQETQIGLIGGELATLKKLLKDGLVQTSRVLAIEREQARLEGERGQLIAERARAEGRIGEINIQMIQIDEEERTQTLTELRDVESRIAELKERQITSKSRLERTSIRSPIAGYVYQLSLHTIGGVIAPGETFMLVAPEADELVLQAQVSPQDIDQVLVGQKAHVRFPGFNSRTTPEIGAEVIQVSADTSQMDQNSPPFYAVRLYIPKQELSRLGDNKLKPGMPAEAFIQTGERSPLSFFLRPLADQLAHTFREN